jgi:hypothetical protein
MKRNIFLALVAVLTISLAATGTVFAQGYGPGGNGPNNGMTGGTLSNHMPSAMAEVLGLNVSDVNDLLAADETFYSIALAQGYTADQLPTLMTSVRAKAVNLAAADGTITVDQATFLRTNQAGIYDGTCIPQNNARSMNNLYSYMYNTGDGTGICDGTCIPQSTSSANGGSMRRAGGRR